MRARTLLVLAIVAVAAVAIAVLVDRGSTPRSPTNGQSLLYPGLAPVLNEIRRIELGLPESEDRIDLEMTDSGWVVRQKNDYPADAGRIRQLLLRLSEAEIVEPKTSNPELYGRLGVADPGEEDGGTALIVGPPADIRLIVGRQETRAGSGTYVRRMDEPQSLLVGQDLGVDSDALEWLDKQIFDLDSASISGMVIEHADGDVLELVRVGERLVVAGIPEGRELSSPGAAQPLTRGLSPLRLDDVLPVSEFDLGDPEATVRYHLDDGRRISARAWRSDDERWIAFDIDLDPVEPTAEPVAESEDQEDPADPAPARADPEDVARRDAELAGWVYRVPSYKYEQIVRRMEDLLKPVEE